MLNGWEAFRGDSTDARDLLFTARRSPGFLVWTQVGVFLAPNTARQAACDLKMKCSYDDRSCDVYLGSSNTKIAQVRTVQESFLLFMIWFGELFFSVSDDECIIW